MGKSEVLSGKVGGGAWAIAEKGDGIGKMTRVHRFCGQSHERNQKVTHSTKRGEKYREKT